ncbi:DUF1289 domain-containing protein [Candidatus Mycalebacterium sp.]
MPSLSNGKPASPCVNICKVENGLCIGCMRTVAEIRAWKTSSNNKKLAIIKSVEKRKKRKLKKQNGSV